VAGVVIWADRRFKLGFGRAFALYVAAYTLGRGWIEYLRVDTVNHVLGLRLNVWTSIILFVLAVAYILISARRNPGRETEVQPTPSDEADETPAPSDDAEETPQTSSTSTTPTDGDETGQQERV
jgi:hypothetical protein